ncbi:MAG: methionyl-tRNA formyltransferase [Deltaproteobacteria bacterium CG11_big_fil_rev_8_21_14_0_20_47_16]|nr:MAG: methionyl-tRNA formyltransferase [Deltaproteobacteria bacterium CG11_big_fil_rev_8_21_14_0_20_47_16]
MKILFFGSAEFAIPTLDALMDAGHDICEVVCQPDRPAGRGQKLATPPLGEHARTKGISLFQSEKLRDPAAIAHCLAHNADIFVVVAYGQIIPNELLTAAKYKCVNLHPSLLPLYRGAAPINWPIIQGDSKTGVSTMYLVEALDAGDVLMQYPVNISDTDTAGDMHDKLAKIGARVMVETLAGLESGKITPQKQDDSKSTYAEKLSKEHGAIKWELPADVIARLVRGLNPWPMAHTQWNGKLVKIHMAHDIPLASSETPGTILKADDKIVVATGQGRLAITQLQMEGSRAMTAADFLNGHPLKAGDKFL